MIGLVLVCLFFLNCVQQYELEKGNFVTYFSVSVRNRLIDESKRHQKHENTISLFSGNEQVFRTAEESTSIDLYSRQEEQLYLAEEIDMLTEHLSKFGVDFKQLEKIGPKQKRSRKLCAEIALTVVQNHEMQHKVMTQNKLPQSELARLLGISEKTIEKHRKYIVTLIIIMSEDYPGIRTFLPMGREVFS